MKCRTKHQINPAHINGQVQRRLGGKVEVTTGKSSSARLAVWALFIGDGEWFLIQSWNKVISTPRKLTSTEIAIWWPLGWMGPAGRVGLIPRYFVFNKFFSWQRQHYKNNSNFKLFLKEKKEICEYQATFLWGFFCNPHSLPFMHFVTCVTAVGHLAGDID